MTKFILIDFETASAISLKDVGAWRYSEDFSTEILCLGYTINGRAPKVWMPYEPMDQTLIDALADPKYFVVAFNVNFEKAIWQNIMVAQYGAPVIAPERWHDAQAVCAMKGLPLGLEKALAALKLGQKDTEGTKTALSFSRFDKQGRLGGDPNTKVDRLARVVEYCRDNDVAQELLLHRTLGYLPTSERKVWLLDQEINHRGLRVDLDFVHAAKKICEDTSRPLLDEFRKITGVNPGQRDKLMAWVYEKGAHIPDMRKETLDAVDHSSFPPEVSRALSIRRILGSSSIKKLDRMVDCVSHDGRARGLLQYHGASTGRWAGRLIQPQNLPRPAKDSGGLAGTILTGDAELVNLLYGNPIEAVSKSLRMAFIPDKGHEFVIGDFASIEARIVLALAGQYDKVNLMADGQDVYCDMAEAIFGHKVTKDEHPELRQVGKNTVLGCGFQMGPAKFHARYAADKPIEFAEQCIQAYRTSFAPLVPKLWYGLERASAMAVHKQEAQEFRGIVYDIEGQWLTCRLPSGRKLWYYSPVPTFKPSFFSDGNDYPGFRYLSYDAGGFRWKDMFGGLATENVVQAIARDLLVNAMLVCEQEYIPIVLTVHDEIVGEPEVSRNGETALRQIMKEGTRWSRELKIPLDVETSTGDRYGK